MLSARQRAKQENVAYFVEAGGRSGRFLGNLNKNCVLMAEQFGRNGDVCGCTGFLSVLSVFLSIVASYWVLRNKWHFFMFFLHKIAS